MPDTPTIEHTAIAILTAFDGDDHATANMLIAEVVDRGEAAEVIGALAGMVRALGALAATATEGCHSLYAVVVEARPDYAVEVGAPPATFDLRAVLTSAALTVASSSPGPAGRDSPELPESPPSGGVTRDPNGPGEPS